jgi:hypothetical protein
MEMFMFITSPTLNRKPYTPIEGGGDGVAAQAPPFVGNFVGNFVDQEIGLPFRIQ